MANKMFVEDLDMMSLTDLVIESWGDKNLDFNIKGAIIDFEDSEELVEIKNVQPNPSGDISSK